MTTSTPTGTVVRERFRAMGTDVELALLDVSPRDARLAFAAARRELDRLAAVFTRFDPDSALSRLNRTRSTHCPPELVDVTLLALQAREATGGRFDPTILGALIRAGYDDDFDVVQRREPAPEERPLSPFHPGDVHVDRATGVITLGGDCQLDLGGIAKGWIVDRILAQLAASGPALVNAGGDITVSEREDGDPWTIALPTTGGTMLCTVERGGVATSGTDRRWWRTADGSRRHHVIDPRTGRPADTDLVRVTVFDDAGCTAAEVDATRLLLAGASLAAQEAHELGITAVLVASDDSITRTGALA